MGRELLPNHGPGCGLARAIEGEVRHRPRPPEAWVEVGRTLPKPTTGADCVVCEIATGVHWVGKLISRRVDNFVEVQLLGASNETRWFERDAVEISTLPAHGWSERQAIAARQRRGEPATVRERRRRAAVVEPVELREDRRRRGAETRRARQGLTFAERKAERDAATLRQSRLASELPLERLATFAKTLGTTVALVKLAYRLHRAVHEQTEPTDDQLLEACARVEVYQRTKGTKRR